MSDDELRLAAVRAVAEAAQALEKSARAVSSAADALHHTIGTVDNALNMLRRTVPAKTGILLHFDSLGRPVYADSPDVAQGAKAGGALANGDKEVVEHSEES